jgi:(S)-mandelate dehydrogenase
MRLERAQSIEDLRRMARRRLPRAVFDFFDGGAESETTLRRNSEAFESIEFSPRIMVDVSSRNLAASILGKPARLPLIIAPTGLAALGWPQADIALARAAGRFGVPFVVSSSSSVRLEDIARAAPDTRLWFQVYVYRDRELVRSLIRRARDCGFEAVVLTADVPLLGQRERDGRNSFSVPIRVTPRMLWDTLRCPRWTYDILTQGVPRMQNFVDVSSGLKSVGSLAALMTSNMDASVSWSDVSSLRADWPGKVVLKGVLSPADASLAVNAGFDAIVVSNHGGRQLDHAPATISVLPEIAATVAGRIELLLDGGVRRGSDIAKVLCLGAQAAMTGRATLFGAAAAGQPGVERALELLRAEFDRCLALIGCPAAAELTLAYLRTGSVINRAAIDCEDLAGDERGIVARQK